MKCVVRISKSKLDYFRKLTRQEQPLEIQAFLIGKIVNPELTVVTDICYTKDYAEQTTTSVRWWMKDYERVSKKAEERGLRVVGDIHSHPNWDAVMSPADYKAYIESGFRVCGIVSTMGKRTRVRFWIAESALPCEIEWLNQI